MHPYETMPPRAFWKTVAKGDLSDIARPKRRLTTDDKVATAGSCFAQHIARALRNSGFDFLDAEPAPPIVPSNLHQRFNFGVYSARYGNIYTTAQLRQLIERALDSRPDADEIWEANGRCFDAFRPAIEPNGFANRTEVLADRRGHLGQVRWLFRNATVFIFTLGLTEAWRQRDTGTVYPVCPGVNGVGAFDSARHEFVNFTFAEVYSDLTAALSLMKGLNPGIRFILTVSPVPLTATASDEHVLVATMYSKSVLRAVAGQVAAERPDVDYFPSYELVASPAMKGAAYAANLRDISPDGVEDVMRVFLSEFCENPRRGDGTREAVKDGDRDVVCEERILESYAE